MFLASLLRRIVFSYYDYKAYNFNIEKTEFVVIHIPDQIGDAMAIFPVIRALELHKIKHLLIVTSTINLEVFNALKLEQTKLTLVTMTMQDHATLKEIKDNVDIPFVLIGGINLDNVGQLKQFNPDGYALVSGILAADDIGKRVGDWLNKI